MINIEKFDHIGIRITERQRAILFYETLGFKIFHEPEFDSVVIMKNDDGVEMCWFPELGWVKGVDSSGNPIATGEYRDCNCRERGTRTAEAVKRGTFSLHHTIIPSCFILSVIKQLHTVRMQY